MNIKVFIEVTASFAWIFNVRNSDRFEFQKEIKEGSTIGSLLSNIASDYADADKVIFDEGTGQISGELLIVLNNNLLQLPESINVKLSDGDRIMLLPIETGG